MSGSTSVTGAGKGMALNVRGEGNGRNFFVPMSCPHVVAAGTATAASNTITITFPKPLSGGHANYVVMITANVGSVDTSACVVSTLTNDANGNFSSFVITTNGASEVVMWCVMTAGYGLELVG